VRGNRCAETLFFDYDRQHKLELKVARIFNTCGPRMRLNDGRVISNFVIQALKGEPVTIYGDGTQTRSFCYVDDLIESFMRLMNSRRELTGPLNLVELVIEMTGAKLRLVFLPLPQDDPKQHQPDLTPATEHFRWRPVVPLREGLNHTIDYF
jgi:UDP-glucuronate decarboxylase